MIIRKQDRKLEVDEPNTKIYDCPLPGVSVGISYQEYAKGRYPERGSWRNTACEEVYYVLNGSARFTVDGQASLVSEGEIVVVPVESMSYMETENSIQLLTITNPDWYPQQHEIVE